MRNLSVFIEKNGKECYVGRIQGTSPSDACFSYAKEYLEDENTAAISISLPLGGDAFSPAQTKNFFEGLLPEGFTRKTVAGWLRVAEEDYLSILAGLGQECLGAIRILGDRETDMEDSYELLSMEQVRELASEGASASAQLVTQAHLSLTGASGKVGLYYDPIHADWYLPKGNAPSTHIVKQSHVRLNGIVVNEQLSLLTASMMGIPVPDSFIINVGTAKDEDVLFATQRYDRKFPPDKTETGVLARPVRLHQEDFAQALSIASMDKYEADHAGYMRQMFEVLRKYSANPIEDQLKLWDIIVFDYLIGNTDNHVKNYSLLYGDNLKNIRLAPAYDIISTVVYKSSTRDMAFHIGGEYTLDAIRREQFQAAAREAGIGERIAMKHLDDLANRFEESLHQAAEQLEENGFANVVQIRDQILQNGGISIL